MFLFQINAGLFLPFIILNVAGHFSIRHCFICLTTVKLCCIFSKLEVQCVFLFFFGSAAKCAIKLSILNYLISDYSLELKNKQKNRTEHLFTHDVLEDL